MRFLAAQTGDQLPLVNQIHIATQRRRRPGVLRDTQPIVRLWRGRHAHFTAGLGAINGRNAFFGKQATPGAIGDDHQLGDQLIERTATLALADLDATVLGVREVTFDQKIVVIRPLHR